MGEGTEMVLGEFCECDPPDIEAVNWFEADVAAAEGSKDVPSAKARPSGMAVGK